MKIKYIFLFLPLTLLPAGKRGADDISRQILASQAKRVLKPEDSTLVDFAEEINDRKGRIWKVEIEVLKKKTNDNIHGILRDYNAIIKILNEGIGSSKRILPLLDSKNVSDFNKKRATDEMLNFERVIKRSLRNLDDFVKSFELQQIPEGMAKDLRSLSSKASRVKRSHNQLLEIM